MVWWSGGLVVWWSDAAAEASEASPAAAEASEASPVAAEYPINFIWAFAETSFIGVFKRVGVGGARPRVGDAPTPK